LAARAGRGIFVTQKQGSFTAKSRLSNRNLKWNTQFLAVLVTLSLPLRKLSIPNLEAYPVPRVAKISLNGCFVDTPKTLPVGSEVVIKIFAESECFAATARVVYANSNSGMGLAFQEVSLKSGALLRQWLQRASVVPNKPDS
jgi:hypothetical protein